MSKVAHQFTRKDDKILNPDGSLHEKFHSINRAKKWSRQFQQANGGLGLGSVRKWRKE